MNNIIDLINNKLSFNNKNILILFDKDNNPWFKAKDIIDILEYKDSYKIIKNNIDQNDKILFEDLKNNLKCDLINNEQFTIFINEFGLYSLILSSKKDESKLFKKWVVSNLFPSIRKYIVYDLQKEKDILILEFNNNLKIKNNEIKNLQIKYELNNNIIDKQNNIINLMKNNIINKNYNNNINEFVLIKKNNIYEYPYYIIISQKIKIVKKINKLIINYPDLEILLRLNNLKNINLYNKMKESLYIKYNGNHFDINDIDEFQLIYEICKLNKN